MTDHRILIVEDDVVIRMNMEEMLVEEGHVVVGVSNTGEHAIQKAEETGPDVILMDIQLAGTIDGREAALEIRRKNDVPVVFVTAHGSKNKSLARDFSVPEGYGYIVKPFTKKELMSEIMRVCP